TTAESGAGKLLRVKIRSHCPDQVLHRPSIKTSSRTLRPKRRNPLFRDCANVDRGSHYDSAEQLAGVAAPGLHRRRSVSASVHGRRTLFEQSGLRGGTVGKNRRSNDTAG